VSSLLKLKKDANVKRQNVLKNIANAIKVVYNAVYFAGVRVVSIIRNIIHKKIFDEYIYTLKT
jgi:hypothetical protein